MWIRGNHMPNIKGTDDGIWRRIHLIPFDVQIPKDKRDSSLPDKLREELLGILRWAIDGVLTLQQDGLRVPEKVVVRSSMASLLQTEHRRSKIVRFLVTGKVTSLPVSPIRILRHWLNASHDLRCSLKSTAKIPTAWLRP